MQLQVLHFPDLLTDLSGRFLPRFDQITAKEANVHAIIFGYTLRCLLSNVLLCASVL